MTPFPIDSDSTSQPKRSSYQCSVLFLKLAPVIYNLDEGLVRVCMMLSTTFQSMRPLNKLLSTNTAQHYV